MVMVVDDSVDLFLFFLLLSTTEYTGISGVYGQDVQLHTYIIKHGSIMQWDVCTRQVSNTDT